MAKILGYSELYKKQYKTICDKCGAIILFDEDEIKDEHQYNEYCFSTATCPSCHSNISFDKNKVEKIKTVTNESYINNFEKDNVIEHITNTWLETTTDINGWPTNISNCKHNCKICYAKCIYRKEKNPNQ